LTTIRADRQSHQSRESQTTEVGQQTSGAYGGLSPGYPYDARRPGRLGDAQPAAPNIHDEQDIRIVYVVYKGSGCAPFTLRGGFERVRCAWLDRPE
jgi:hypothetical protein